VKRALVIAAVAAACSSRRSAPPPPPPDDAAPGPLQGDVDRTLDSGLRLHLHPVPGSGKVALVVLFRIGSDQDPPGRSGLAHLIEHLYVTAAAGSSPPRPVEAWIRGYPDGWNAQTGSDYTVVAGVFPAARLDDEVADAVARMTDLHIDADDLSREVPRLVTEVDNMFAVPALAAANRARERARPAPNHGRKGGVAAEVRSLGVDDVTARWRSLYRGGNAVVVIAGELDDRVPARIGARLAAVPAGEPAPAPAASPPGEAGIDRFAAPGPGLGCIAHRAPATGSPDYPGFLIATGVLMRAATVLVDPATGGFPVRFAPLDEPEVLAVCAPPRPRESPEALVARLDRFVATSVGGHPVTPDDAAFVERAFGPLLGTGDRADPRERDNLYGAAFARARRIQLGLDGAALRDRLRAVASVDAVTAAWLAPAGRGAAVATPR